MLRILILAFAIGLAGCSVLKPSHPLHPNAASPFDSNAYDAVLLYHDAIEQAKSDIVSGSFPESSRPFLNKFVELYNGLDGVYKTYHTAATSGAATNVLTAQLTDALAQAATGFSDLVKLDPKTAKPAPTGVKP
jgi:hypothetical protein